MSVSLKGRIVALTLLAAVAPMIVMLGLTLNVQTRVLGLVEHELNGLAAQNIGQVARDVYGLCRTANDLVQGAVNRDLQVARDVLRRAGRPALAADTVAWEAVNQVTLQSTRITLPRMTIGDLWLGQNRDRAVPTPMVDDVTRLAGGTCTIFQRLDEPRGMLRVATTVLDADGRRAIGTFIPETEPDGSPNPVLAAILKGETYRGVAYVVNTRYVTAYEPIRDGEGRIIGMLYVGEKIEAVEALRQSIMDIRVGRSGYVSVLGGQGAHQGRYIISMKDPKAAPPAPGAPLQGLRDGENPLQDKDPAIREVIRDFLDRALAAPEGEVVLKQYPWKNPGEDQIRNKIGAALYFKPWDWVIVATAYEDDYLAAHTHVRAAISGLSRNLLGAGAFILLLAAAAAILVGTVLVRPLRTVIALAGRVAAGDVNGARALLAPLAPTLAARRGAAEVRTLLQAFHTMTESLHALITQMQHAGIQVTTSATQIAASARELEATAAEQAASSKEVNATSRDIAAVSEKLVSAMETIGQGAAETARTAETGRSGLQRMEAAVRQLAQATASISAKLGVISDRAHTISGVVTTITRISDQTNLLALNAAIEAEKAGEYGKGFAVVARETSRLADQTAAATQDIEQMVKDMQGSVSSGVMEMDKFSEEVRRGGDTVAAIGDQLGQVIDQVKALAPSFDSVKDGMRGQATSAQQISEAIHQLSVAAEQTRQALHEFNQAADQLNGAVHGLKTEVSRFVL